MSEYSGKYLEYYSQSWQLRRQTKTGILKMREEPGDALPLHRHLEYNVAVEMVIDRERYLIAEGDGPQVRPQGGMWASLQCRVWVLGHEGLCRF